MTKSQLKEPVNALIQDYQRKISEIKADQSSEPTREFISLFSNPYVQVVNNLEKDPLVSEMIVRNYCNELKDIYPDGVTVSYNPNAVRLGAIRKDLVDEFIIPARFTLILKAFPSGVVFENKQLLELLISFKWDGEAATNFRITSISLAKFDQQEIGIRLQGGGSDISANWLKEESRFTQPLSPSWAAGFSYKYWSRPGFSVSTGMLVRQYRSLIQLDKMNPFMGHDPNFSKIEYATSLYQVEIPVLIGFKTQQASRINWYTEVGLIGSYRFWEQFDSKAIQTNYGEEIRDIVSDYDWDENLNRFFVAFSVEGGGIFRITNRLQIQAGLAIVSGISPIDLKSDDSFPADKYTGQYNPLWMDPASRNFVRFAGFNLGFSYLIDRKDE